MVVSNHSGVSSGEHGLGFDALATSRPEILCLTDSAGSVHPELVP